MERNQRLARQHGVLTTKNNDIMKRLLFLLLGCVFALPLSAQWSSDPLENKVLVDSDHYSSAVAWLEDGRFYLYMNMAFEDIHRIHSYLYFFDKDGNAIWDEPVIMGGDSTRAFTKTMSRLMVDDEDNAIVVRQSFKTKALETYTAYKINEEGAHLWPEEGVDLYGDGLASSLSIAALKMTQLEDGDYVFAWMDNGIMAQKISREGERLWGDGKNLGGGAYPYLVDAGRGDFIMGYQGSEGLMARRMDFDGNDVWIKPVVAFDGDLSPSVPTWTYLDFIPVEGGGLFSFYAFDGGMHYPCLAYVKADGTLGFVDGSAGCRIDYSLYAGFSPSVIYDAEHKVIYACWASYAGSQSNERFAAQKVSLDGELLWDSEGLEILPLKHRTLKNPTLALGSENTVLFNVLENIGIGNSASDPLALQSCLVDADGKFVWSDTLETVSGVESYKGDVFCSPHFDNQWILVWEDCRDYGGMVNSWFYGQNIDIKGRLGNDVRNESIVESVNQLQIYPNPVVDDARIVWLAASMLGQVEISLLDMSGRVVAEVGSATIVQGENRIDWIRPVGLPAGMYLLQMESSQGRVCAKVILQ